MKHRCARPDQIRNKRWAGRGISVCAEWQTYEGFRDWANANGYANGLTIDRIDNTGNYEPVNCEWVSRAENSRRCRATHKALDADTFGCMWAGD